MKCEKNLMKVNIEFDRPFNGLVFSKGHYSDPKCVHLPAGKKIYILNYYCFIIIINQFHSLLQELDNFKPILKSSLDRVA